ncbi:MAG: L-galactose dehydrogenase [Hyperionvirus sp.]|uniref:L-galactose dehydrogenase n=1 Tax=Hyperionvirus sp. TaxID=2487770 RepID=A0A3G5A9Q9_9VIRU|nr:MAG: L-galactose dehydrogenase [Hyperionvirus sp.]
MLRSIRKVGLGCAGFGNVYGPRAFKSLEAVISIAMKNNIKYFDTAPYYNSSEQIVGQLLSRYPREKYMLSTKVGRFAPNDKKHPHGYFDFSKDSVIRSVMRSCHRLKTKYLDVVHCHDIEYADPQILLTETLPTLAQLKKSGIIRNIGISGYPLSAIRAILYCSPTPIDFATCYSHYTLQNNLLQSFCWGKKRHDITLVNSGILGMGLLTEQGPQPWHPASPKLKAAALKAANYCRTTENIDIAEIATKYALSATSDIADIALIGAYTPDELEQILKWEQAQPDKKIVNNIQAIFNKANCKNKLWPPSPHHTPYHSWPN